MGTNPTALFLDLAARARHLSDRDAAGLLATGRRAWCEVGSGGGRRSARRAVRRARR